MPEISLGLVASQRSWRTEFQSHARDHVGGIKVKVLREPRMALEEALDVLVIDDVSTFLTRGKVIALRERGVRVIGIYDPLSQEGLGERFLDDLGVDLTLPSTMAPEEIIRAITALGPATRQIEDDFNQMVVDMGVTWDVDLDLTTDIPAPAPSDQAIVPRLRGRVIVVGGPAGSGVTEVAIALTDALAQRGQRPVVVDLDETSPSVGRRLCYRLHPNVLTAMETMVHRNRPLHEAVGRRSDGVSSSMRFDAIPGIANIEDWVQLREHEVQDLIAGAARVWSEVVINTGSNIEDLSGVGLERFGASRTALGEADTIIGVCSPTPAGVLKFLDWMSNLRSVGIDQSVFIVINKVPNGLFGRTGKGKRDLRALINRFPGAAFHKAELEQAIYENIDEKLIAGILLAPYDEKVSTAMWDGRPVSNGPFKRSIKRLADLVAPKSGIRDFQSVQRGR